MCVLPSWATYKESPPHKQHIWFLPTCKAIAEKTKRTVFCQRSDKVIDKEKLTLNLGKFKRYK